MGFITTIGYDFEKDTKDWFHRVAMLIEHPGVATAAQDLVPRFGLSKNEASKQILAALMARASAEPASGFAEVDGGPPSPPDPQV
jgi:hypothetical protein